MYNSKYMCLAIPGRIIEKKGEKIIVEYPGEKRTALAGGMDVKSGEFVLIQMGIAIKKVTEAEAKRSWKAWKSVSK